MSIQQGCITEFRDALLHYYGQALYNSEYDYQTEYDKAMNWAERYAVRQNNVTNGSIRHKYDGKLAEIHFYSVFSKFLTPVSYEVIPPNKRYNARLDTDFKFNQYRIDVKYSCRQIFPVKQKDLKQDMLVFICRNGADFILHSCVSPTFIVKHCPLIRTEPKLEQVFQSKGWYSKDAEEGVYCYNLKEVG